MMFRWKICLAAGVALALAVAISCVWESSASPPVAPAKVGSTNQQAFIVKGLIKELKPDGKTVVIKHEAVPDYMPAMTMPFEVHDTNELRTLKPGDAISFQMIVTDNDAWIQHIRKINAARPAELPSRASYRLVRDVDPLALGDPLPPYRFTNEFAQPVTTGQFKGGALVFTFFFTRCPYPTFCPFLSHSFETAQNILLATANAPTNWHFLSVSFDTETDSPAVLKAYAAHYDYRPEHWSFVTGDLTDITALGDQVGAYFGHDESGGVTHNLRTVVIDARGRVQKIFTDNKWTARDLVAEVTKAARAKP